jgi:hypothetical protein
MGIFHDDSRKLVRGVVRSEKGRRKIMWDRGRRRDEKGREWGGCVLKFKGRSCFLSPGMPLAPTLQQTPLTISSDI